MLQDLEANGYYLVFLSNCSEAYMKLHQEVFGLDRIFHEMHCAGQFDWEDKPQIVRRLIPAWTKNVNIISIGDRYTDMAIRQAAHPPDAVSAGKTVIKTVFCTYGFGTPEEGKGADALAHSAGQIPEAINSCKLPFDGI